MTGLPNLPTLDDAERFFAQQHGVDDTELPYPQPSIPQYRLGKYRRWELGRVDVPMIRGYFKGMQLNTNNNYVLYRRSRGVPETWMSLTPMELESHMPHIAAATGKVAVVGLGMGMYLHNVLQKSDVTSVTMFEKDRQVTELLKKRSDFTEWPDIGKLRPILYRDVLTCNPINAEFDHLYVDIWATLGDENARANMVSVSQRIRATSHSWWGMELDFIEWCTTHMEEGQKLTEEDVRRLAEPWALACTDYQINVTPVVSQPEWPVLALKAAHNVTLY